MKDIKIALCDTCLVFLEMLKDLVSPVGRNVKTYQRANHFGVKKILSWVKSLQNFTLFCQQSALFGVIFLHILEFYVTFWHLLALFGCFGPFTLFCRKLDLL